MWLVANRVKMLEKYYHHQPLPLIYQHSNALRVDTDYGILSLTIRRTAGNLSLTAFDINCKDASFIIPKQKSIVILLPLCIIILFLNVRGANGCEKSQSDVRFFYIMSFTYASIPYTMNYEENFPSGSITICLICLFFHLIPLTNRGNTCV